MLIDNFPSMNIHIENDFAFRISCQNGHFDIAKMLMNKFPNINIRACYALMITLSCQNGHLNIAEWLIENYQIYQDFDIHVNNEYIFRYVCRFG